MIRLLAVSILFLLVLTSEWPVFGDEAVQLQSIVTGKAFDFLDWEAQAFTTKSQAVLANTPQFLTQDAQKQIVLDYLALIAETQKLRAEIDAVYADPAVAQPEIASQPLQAQFQQNEAAISELQPTAEAIVQEQVATILVEQGFGVLGEAWPPVMMHMTPLPTLLMVSPRDRIERIYSHSLRVDVTTPEHERLETAVFEQLDLSALVVPIGGLGTYPAMILQTSNLTWLVEVVAHEWSHHWMGFFPIGLNYTVDPQVRSINETVASTFDKEIADLVIERYYPEFLPPPPPPEPEEIEETETAVPTPEPPAFDFNTEMAETRIQVDQLLAEGKIEAAEQYMEARRRYFVENGYAIRKLNQAYFAFYGAYQAQPGGAPGKDPIGPLVRQVRSSSPTLREFMDQMATVGSLADLEVLAAQSQANSE